MRIDIDRIISEIEQLERIFSEPDTRALSACDLAAANRRHDEKQARSPWFQLFVLIALNCALRNGDAHLKNFGIVYDDVQGGARLAPVYDLVTTSVYLPKDSMAPTLNGTTK